MIITYNSLVREKYIYNKKEIISHIIICKNSIHKNIGDKYKISLFKKMSKVVVKNVDNFFYLTKNHSKQVFHTKDDLVIECYLVFEKCIRDFDHRKFSDFLWYYNKALSRAVLRIVEKNYNKHMNVDSIEEKHDSSNFVENEADFTDYYMSKLNLSRLERRIIKSRLNKEKIEEFLKRNRDVNENSYYKNLNQVKEKLKNFL